MGGIGMMELLVVLAIILLVFGTHRLRNLGGDLGEAVRGFKKALRMDDKGEPAAPAAKRKMAGNARRDEEDSTQN